MIITRPGSQVGQCQCEHFVTTCSIIFPDDGGGGDADYSNGDHERPANCPRGMFGHCKRFPFW